MRLLLPALFLFTYCYCTSVRAQQVIITGLIDGDLSGGTPKALELYVSGTVDLANYDVQVYSNANTTPSRTSGLSGTYTDAFVYVTGNEVEFQQLFGSSGDFTNLIDVSLSVNGNDAVLLLNNGTTVDQTGGPIGDATNLYQDSYLYRADGTGPDGSWVAANWSIPGNGTLDGLTASEQGNATPFGTYTPPGGGGPTVTVSENGNLGEPNTDGGFTITLTQSSGNDVTVTYSLGGTATGGGTDYTDTDGGSVTITAGQTSTTVDLTAVDDADIEGTETIELTLQSVSDSTYGLGGSETITVEDDDLGGTILISTVQGDGDASPLVGNTVTVEAVVTGVFQAGLGGYYIQEEDSDQDGDPATSEGIFVEDNVTAVSQGDLVEVTGNIVEQFDQTVIDVVTAGAVSVQSQNNTLPAVTKLSLPLGDDGREALEGMRVEPQNVVITDLDNFSRFGEVGVTSGERLIQYTECNEPSDATALAAYQDQQDRDLIIIDDGRNGSNNQPILLPDSSVLSETNVLRAGQSINNLTGILGFAFGQYRIHPTDREAVVFAGNPRPTSAPAVGGQVKIVSANVLNYFTTLNQRGADNATELQRQQEKIVNALCALEGDIVGLVEIENTLATGANSAAADAVDAYVALRTLIDALAEACGIPYDYVVSPNPGDDQIMVALIYRTDRIAEAGTAAALATPADLFVGPGTNRVPAVQTFRVIDTGSRDFGELVTVTVNHFKSKGSGCGAGDDDPGGAGNCNGTRRRAAGAIVDWLASDPTGASTDNIVVLGDLNAYRQEDPIDSFLTAGYLNAELAAAAPGGFPCGGGTPSYVFRGQWGSLDYALISSSLEAALTGAAVWPVNAPEIEELDYNTEGASDTLYADDFYRFSDHDPVIIGLTLSDTSTSTGYIPDSPHDIRLLPLGGDRYAVNGLPDGRVDYALVDAAGRLLATGRLVGERAELTLPASLPAGVYFVRLTGPRLGLQTVPLARGL